jgi:acylphosphatase
MLTCKRVCYSGKVQGVGFRYTAQHLAAGFAVSGWIRNLTDGRVELVAEGAADQVAAFLDALARRMQEYIDTTTVTAETATGLQGFGIRF